MIKRLFKLHLGLIKFLMVQIPKQVAKKELGKFLKKIAIEYVKVMIKEYKDLFLFMDSDYMKQKKQFERQQSIKKDLQRALTMLRYIDTKMAKEGKSRQERKLFWRDFYRNGMTRGDTFEALSEELK